MTIQNNMTPIHPGQILRDELAELGLSASTLAHELGVPVNRVTMILNAQRGITADTALRLSRFFETSAEFWMNLQQTYELQRVRQEMGSDIEQAVTAWSKRLALSDD